MQNSGSGLIEEFQYPPSGVQSPSLWEGLPEIGTQSKTLGNCSSPGARHAGNSQQAPMIEDREQVFESGRAQGIEEGRRKEHGEMQQSLNELEHYRRDQLAQLAAKVAEDRNAFLHSIEQEVVKLALSIAARILRREAEIDPLFLTGAIRVALGELGERAAVRLRIPAQEAELWTDTIAHLPGVRTAPVVIPDEHLAAGDALIETDAGFADLGVRSQLAEIARLFDDLSPAIAARRPSAVRLEAEGPR